MADEVESKQETGTQAKMTVPVVPLVLTTVVAVVIAMAGAGGVGLWLVRSGRLPVVQGAARPAATATAEPVKTKLVVLEPLLVNLADGGGHSYLRTAITLRVEDPPPAKGEKAKEPEKGKPTNENEAAMRDAALGVLGGETAAALLAPNGKERLKSELRVAMREHVPEAKVVDVLLTEFLVQQ